jgi:hypothetical protein
MVFINRTGRIYQLCWIGYDGKNKSYGKLNAHERSIQDTFVTHPWAVVGGNEKVVAVFLPKKRNCLAIVE